MLEVIACSVADAVAAEQGGADRLEIVRDLSGGGLTPSLVLIRDILAAVRLPVRVMLREDESFFVSDVKKIERLCDLARSIAALPSRVDGLVLGFLKKGGQGNELNHELLARVLACAPHLNATFHRAFETLPDPVQAAQELKRHRQIDRILTSGGAQSWPQKWTGLAELERAAQPEIAVLAGGGVNAAAIELLCRRTMIQEFHVGSAAREPQTATGAVQTARVQALVQALVQAKKGKGICS